ncbi:Hypothetical predicted protein, partial [Podarcis lilfordi]
SLDLCSRNSHIAAFSHWKGQRDLRNSLPIDVLLSRRFGKQFCSPPEPLSASSAPDAWRSNGSESRIARLYGAAKEICLIFGEREVFGRRGNLRALQIFLDSECPRDPTLQNSAPPSFDLERSRRLPGPS